MARVWQSTTLTNRDLHASTQIDFCVWGLMKNLVHYQKGVSQKALLCCILNGASVKNSTE